jgi:hypothetical protein
MYGDEKVEVWCRGVKDVRIEGTIRRCVERKILKIVVGGKIPCWDKVGWFGCTPDYDKASAQLFIHKYGRVGRNTG